MLNPHTVIRVMRRLATHMLQLQWGDLKAEVQWLI